MTRLTISIDVGAPVPLLVYKENGYTVLKHNLTRLRMGALSALWVIDTLQVPFNGMRELKDDLGRVVLRIEKSMQRTWILGETTRFSFDDKSLAMIIEALLQVVKEHG